MLIKVQIGKTWQENPYEPFNITLSMDYEIGTSKEEVPIIMKKLAKELQITIEEIYNDRTQKLESNKSRVKRREFFK